MRNRPLEITDLLWLLNADGHRVPVVRDEVIEQLLGRGQRRAAAIVRTMPAIDGHLDPNYVDRLALRIHSELQRLSEELQMGRRVTELLVTTVQRLQASGPGPIRIVDIGCGLGYVIRSMAARAALDDEVELVGVDLNPVLIDEARRLADHEGLRCHFVRGDALRAGVAIDDGPRTIVISTGLLHHLNESDLVGFFAGQADLGVAAFAHWDIAPCFWSTLGAWVFHQARMREPVSRHDGVLSARRAYPADVLASAARLGAPAYACEVREGSRWHPRALDVLRPLVGWRS